MTIQPTEQPVEPEEPENGWAAYQVALVALGVAATVEAGRVFDWLVPTGVLVEETPDRVRGLLVAALARSWVAYRARGAALASVYAAAWRTGVRSEVVEPVLPPPPSADIERLRTAAATMLDRATDMAVRADDIDAARLDDGDDLVEDLAELERVRAAEAAAEAAEIAALAEADALAEAEEVASEAALDADIARRNAEADADEAARRRAVDEADDRDRRAAREGRRTEADAARREARRERRQAQRARAERIARAEVAQAAHETLQASLATASEVVGWVRKLDPNPCERCVAWWRSGGDPRGATPVRPYSVRMKRHNGCCCTQVPTTHKEGDVRGYTTEPEPVHRNRGRDPRSGRT